MGNYIIIFFESDEIGYGIKILMFSLNARSRGYFIFQYKSFTQNINYQYVLKVNIILIIYLFYIHIQI